MKLQSILCPKENICNEETLYFHREGDWVSFDGYFNLFYLEKHHKYCDIDKLTLELETKGISKIQVVHDRDVVLEEKVDDKIISLELPYGEYGSGVLYFRVLPEQGCADSWLVRGWYEAACERYRETNIAVNICTYKREPYVLRNMKSLVEFWEREKDAQDFLHVFIIDNGQTLRQNPEFDMVRERGIEIIENSNTGGTGGFSRGMAEAMNRRQELGLTHLLMMDDDAVFDPDIFIRLYGFLSTLRDEYREITVGGALMREDYQYIQHACGEWFTNFRVINEHPLMDMRTFDACTQDFITTTKNEHNLYGAWWCCCYHMNAIAKENMPLPIFVHHDDIQFGMRQKDRGIVFLNGISVWHQGFETAFPGVKQYYNMRNTLITMQMYEPEILNKGMLYWAIRRYIGMLINYRYADCEFVFRGLMDFCKGKEWLLQTNPEALHKELMDEYKRICPMTPIDELQGLTPKAKKHVKATAVKNLTPDQLREYYNSERFEGPSFKKLTFNGWFLPPRKKLKIITPLDTPWATYRQKYILLFEPATGKGAIVRRDNREFFKGLIRILRMCMTAGARKQDWNID